MKAWRRGKFGLLMLALQALFIVLFAIFVDYEESADPHFRVGIIRQPLRPAVNDSAHDEAHGDHGTREDPVQKNANNVYYYGVFQDVRLMVFVGFGFLLTFLKRSGFNSIGMNYMIACLTVQWSTLVGGFFHMHDGVIHIDMETLVWRDICAAAVLISWCAVLGRVSPLQTALLVLLEIPIYHLNEWIGIDHFGAKDVGGSMYVHTFGCYFGLAMSFVLYRGELKKFQDKSASVYHSDIFAMIGTIFLFIFWPSFNSALLPSDERHRAVLNTVYSLAACVGVVCAISSAVSKEDKLDMVHIQNSTLAGGVVVGAVADMVIHPWGALVLGSISGIVSVIGFSFITPFMAKKLHIHDTCGINNLHGLPGVISGLASAVVAAMASESIYGQSLYEIFPRRIPEANTTEFTELSKLYDIEPGDGRTAQTQALYQLAALGVTLLLSVIGGLIAGAILRAPAWNRPKGDGLFDDKDYWELPEEPEVKPELLMEEKDNSL